MKYFKYNYIVFILYSISVLLVFDLRAQNNPPQIPEITEPPTNGTIVNPSDVHMETAPFVDQDGDSHVCSDWEIFSQN